MFASPEETKQLLYGIVGNAFYFIENFAFSFSEPIILFLIAHLCRKEKKILLFSIKLHSRHKCQCALVCVSVCWCMYRGRLFWDGIRLGDDIWCLYNIRTSRYIYHKTYTSIIGSDIIHYCSLFVSNLILVDLLLWLFPCFLYMERCVLSDDTTVKSDFSDSIRTNENPLLLFNFIVKLILVFIYYFTSSTCTSSVWEMRLWIWL